MPSKYKTIRLREQDYQKMKEVQKLLRRKGLDSIDWAELKRQDLIEVDDDEGNDEDDSEEFTWGFLIGLGAAALAYFLSKKQQEERR